MKFVYVSNLPSPAGRGVGGEGWLALDCDAGGAYDTAMTFRLVRAALIPALIVAHAGCATYEPLRYGEVVTMKAGEASGVSGYPPPGTVWRLDQSDLKTLSPAPTVEPPPPPRYPPPPPPGYYPPPPPPGWYSAPY